MGSLAYQLRCRSLVCNNTSVSCKAKPWLCPFFVNTVWRLQRPHSGHRHSSSVTGKACTLLENENRVELYRERTSANQSISQSVSQSVTPRGDSQMGWSLHVFSIVTVRTLSQNAENRAYRSLTCTLYDTRRLTRTRRPCTHRRSATKRGELYNGSRSAGGGRPSGGGAAAGRSGWSAWHNVGYNMRRGL